MRCIYCQNVIEDEKYNINIDGDFYHTDCKKKKLEAVNRLPRILEYERVALDDTENGGNK